MKIIIHYSKASIMLLYNWLVGGSIVIALFTFLHLVFLYLVPSSYVFEYHSVEPIKLAFYHHETIEMRTTADWHREADVEWVDTLRCPPIHFVSQAITEGHKYDGDKARGNWLYQKPTPVIDSECYMESTIIATIEYGIKKKQTIKSPEFIIR